MNEVHIHVVKSQLFQAEFKRSLRIMVIKVPELRGDIKLITCADAFRDRFLNSLSDYFFIFVLRCSVNVSVTILDSSVDRVDIINLRCPKAHDWHVSAIIQFDSDRHKLKIYL